MKRLYVLFLISCLSLGSCDVLQTLVAEPTALENITALKEVLNSSAFRTLQKLQKINNDGFNGMVPDEIQPVLGALKSIGLGGKIEGVENTINKATQVMAGESGALMKDAIAELDFDDAVAVITGGPDAATQVAKGAMYAAVQNRYSARLNQELDKTDANKYWPIAANAYNLFADNKVDANLSDFLAKRAVDAMFNGMGREEAEIRKDPSSLGSAVVTKVFNYYNSGK